MKCFCNKCSEYDLPLDTFYLFILLIYSSISLQLLFLFCIFRCRFIKLILIFILCKYYFWSFSYFHKAKVVVVTTFFTHLVKYKSY